MNEAKDRQTMGMDYIRRTYGVPVRRGGRIRYDGGDPHHGPQLGTICSATNSGHIRVRFDGERRTHKLHPTWAVVYLKPPNAQTQRTDTAR